MGVRGLKTYMEREEQCRPINMQSEIIRCNPDRTPLLVLDFMSLLNSGSRPDESICGGRHRRHVEHFEEIFKKLAYDCKLVFFCDLKVQSDKIPVWLKRRNEDSAKYANLFDTLGTGRPLNEVVPALGEIKPVMAIFYSISVMARKYGEFRFCNDHECDLELARYATENDALAIVSNDSDFLIFPGAWRFWACDRLTANLNATEFDRNGMARRLALSAEQRPLYATLLGNDFTGPYFRDLSQFFTTLGAWPDRFGNVAAFVRRMQRNKLTSEDFRSLSRQIFYDEHQFELLRDSVNSYRLDYAKIPGDKIARQIAGSVEERFYLEVMADVQSINLPFCDMRGVPANANITNIFGDMLKRMIGVVRIHDDEPSYTFIMLSRQSSNEQYQRTVGRPIYPDFAVPTLHELYFDRTGQYDENRWQIFAWVASIAPNVVDKLKTIPKAYAHIVTVLCILVKNRLLDVKQADGILLTEHKSLMSDQEVHTARPPRVVDVHMARAAHLYNIGSTKIRERMMTCGLSKIISDYSLFDGVYFQNLMNMASARPILSQIEAIACLKPLRIYATMC